MRKQFFLIAILSSFGGFSQSMDSVLTVDEFYRLVYVNHPLAKQAELIRERGQLELSGSRGYFDPKLVSNYSFKEFDNKTYYDLWDSYLQLPTALNLDFKVGFERNSGGFLNPQNTVPGSGLYYAGVSVPLGNGLFVNERTYALRQGKLTKEQLENEASIVMNNLLLDASYTFWYWNASFQKVQLFQEARDLALVRFNGLRESVFAGDKAPIDSVESLIQVQQFQNEFSKSQAEFVNYTLALQNMLWSDSTLDDSIPSVRFDIMRQELPFYEDFAIGNHPDLIALNIKSAQLSVDRRFYAEQLKPNLNLNYNFLLAGQDAPQSQQGFQMNNYKAGINFSMPLLLRKERSKLGISKLKISENDLKTDLKSREVLNKVRASFNQVATYLVIINQQRAAVENYQRMLEGERSKFDNGESSVFLVNSRENKLVEARLKLIDMEATYRTYIGQLFWASGYLPEYVRSLQ
jgi:outer membrane protein TolC